MLNELVLYTPHSMQLKLHECETRFAVASFGRQSGKSTYGINELLRWAWEKPGTRYWFVSPTFPQARVMYRRLIGMLWPVADVMLKKNQTELRVKLVNQSEIRFVSGEVLDNLRGETLHGAIIDEVRDQHPDLWPMVIRPMLTTTRGKARFISTPNGYDAFYDLAQNSVSDPENWSFFKAPSTCNPLFSQEEFDAAKRSMSESQFAQEILADFRDLTSGRAYSNFSEENMVTSCPWLPDADYSNVLPIVLGLDFNLNPMSWSLGQLHAGRWYWFDEVHLENSHTQEAADFLVEKIVDMVSHGFRADPMVRIVADASGKAGQRAAGGRSDMDIVKMALRKANITLEDKTPDANPGVKDRVNAMQAKLRSADGAREFFVHRLRCPFLKRDLERVTWSKSSGLKLDPGQTGELTHPSDSVGYPVAALTPIKPPSSMKPKVIVRAW